MNDLQKIGLATFVFVVLAALLVVMLYTPRPDAEAPERVPTRSEATSSRPRPVPVAAPAKPRPVASVKAREEPEPEPTPVSADTRQEYNYAMRDAIKEMRLQCFEPWIEEEPGPAATVVVDAVVTDGELTDIGIRGIGDVPDDVIECARDAGWAVDWPTFDGQGDLRFQETMTVGG